MEVLQGLSHKGQTHYYQMTRGVRHLANVTQSWGPELDRQGLPRSLT